MTADTGLRGLALLDAAIAQIEAHPDEWDQQVWRCGTGMCLAGHVAIMGGAQWLHPERPDDDDGDLLVAEPDDGPLAMEDGYERVSTRAERLLGFRRAGVLGDLFDPFNDLDGIRAMRDGIAANGAS